MIIFHFTEYIVVFNGYYSTSARDGYVMAALDSSAVNSWKIIPRHNPASDYPSDFSLVKVCIQHREFQFVHTYSSIPVILIYREKLHVAYIYTRH